MDADAPGGSTYAEKSEQAPSGFRQGPEERRSGAGGAGGCGPPPWGVEWYTNGHRVGESQGAGGDTLEKGKVQ
jgi:hypothetical protein